MTSIEEVIIRMRERVMTTPVRPAIEVNTKTVGVWRRRKQD